MTRSDSIVIILMLILLYFSYSSFWNFNSDVSDPNNYAQITVTGAEQQKVLLDQDRNIKIAGRIGIATIQIKNKKIHFLHSPCTKKYCIHSGWLEKVGSTAVCIPNGIIISIKSPQNVYDAINF